MAFNIGNSGNAMLGSAAGAGGLGPDLETIQTEDLGFHSIAGDAKVRLTTPWSSLPSPTASLLSVASRKGLVAAAGPDQIIIATTESVRKAFEAPKDGDSDIRSFEPQLKIPMPMRVSQLSFTADENYLILSAETGGGLAVYEVQTLLQGSTNSAFELPTNGEPLRLLVPNPTPDKAELCAIVTNSGNLHMANLKERAISNPLKDQVSCVSWSSKGKQLCAGLGDGTVLQMTPEGEGKAQIPRPPNMGDCHVSSLTWLENNLWLSIYTPNNESPPSSVYHVITRQPPSAFEFRKLTDPIEPFGADKAPHHSILRLRDFPPALQDLLIVSSTAATEVGVLSRSKIALATDKPADAITGVFTTTEFLDDTRRPTLPMTDSMEDSTSIGVALDLSSKDKVYRPIPSDVELEESPTPLPGFWLLTHEGVLCLWWVVYNESIRQSTTYPGMTVAEGSGANALAPATSTPSTLPFSKSGASTFGSTVPATPAFGSSSQLGQKASPWAGGSSTAPSTTGAATFGASSFGGAPASSSPAFGKPSALGFGQSSQLGMRASPWATATGASGSSPAFGQSAFTSFTNNANKSPFANATATADSSAAPSKGFASFATKTGFAALAKNDGSSVFNSGSKPSSNPFASDSADTAFPPKQDKPDGSVFGSTPFKLESSFKPDPTAKDDGAKPTGSSMFGKAFGSALHDTAAKSGVSTPGEKDDDMDTSAEAPNATPQANRSTSVFGAAQQSPESTTPTTTPAPSKFGFPSTTPATSVFGQPSKPPTTSSGGLFGSSQDTPKPAGGLFGSQQSTPKPSSGLFGNQSFLSQKQDTPKTTEQQEEERDAPLPPVSTSKVTYPFGDSSSSTSSKTSGQVSGLSVTPTKTETAPLPPDFTLKPKSNQVSEDAPLPPDFVKVSKPKAAEDAPLPPNPFASKGRSEGSYSFPSGPQSPEDESDLEEGDVDEDEDEDEDEGEDEDESEDEGEDEDEGDEEESEGSGVDVAKDLSPETTGIIPTSGYSPQGSFGGPSETNTATVRPEQAGGRPLFGEVSRNAPLFPRPSKTSPRSPSPMRNAALNTAMRSELSRSASAPGMVSQDLGPKQPRSQLGASIISKGNVSTEDPFMVQHRKMKARQEAEEMQPLVDEEDDEIQKILASEVEGSLALDEFIAHVNVAPPAKESIPSQVEAVYRDINSMIDTLGLNARTLKSFIKGHTENRKEDGRSKEDLEMPEDWVLCEVNDLGEVLDDELGQDLTEGRVRDLEDKLDACHELSRDMHRLHAKQEDIKKILNIELEKEKAEITRSLPLSAEQATQQNELRREFAKFSKLLAEAEEAVTLLKTRMASASGPSGKGNTNMPTVEAVMRTIDKMTTMAEKRSGDVDVLENQLRRVHLGSASREGSPMVTPQARKSIMFSPESTPIRSFRHSLAGSVSLGASVRATPPRKKLSGFSKEEKGDLMAKRAHRQAVLGKLKDSVQKRGVTVWNMEDIE